MNLLRPVRRGARFAPLAALAVAACSSSSSGPSPFNGSWSCTTTSTYTETSPTNGTTFTDSYASTVVIDVDVDDPVTIVFPSVDGGQLGTGGAGCSLSYSTSGDMASLAPKQTCPVVLTGSGGTLTLDITYTTGSGTVSGGMMTFSGTQSFSGMATKGAVSVAVSGTVSSATTCKD